MPGQPRQTSSRPYSPHAIPSRTLELQNGTLLKSRTGMPLSWSGNFAVVFKFNTQSQTKAVRCFTHNLPAQQRRYETLTRYLYGNRPQTLEDFEYQPGGILIRGDNYPILKMNWLDGSTLDDYVYNNIGDPQALAHIARTWIDSTNELRSRGIAHNDLQHGNVIIQGTGQNTLVKIHRLRRDVHPAVPR